MSEITLANYLIQYPTVFSVNQNHQYAKILFKNVTKSQKMSINLREQSAM